MKYASRGLIERHLLGRTVVGIEWRHPDPSSRWPIPEDSNSALSIRLDDGSVLTLESSGQIGTDDVWIELETPSA